MPKSDRITILYVSKQYLYLVFSVNTNTFWKNLETYIKRLARTVKHAITSNPASLHFLASSLVLLPYFFQKPSPDDRVCSSSCKVSSPSPSRLSSTMGWQKVALLALINSTCPGVPFWHRMHVADVHSCTSSEECLLPKSFELARMKLESLFILKALLALHSSQEGERYLRPSLV